MADQYNIIIVQKFLLMGATMVLSHNYDHLLYLNNYLILWPTDAWDINNLFELIQLM